MAARVHAREVAARTQAALDTAKDMTIVGAPIAARLESFGKIEVPVPANTCHSFIYKLAPDAKPSRLRISIDFQTKRSSEGGLTGFDTEGRVASTTGCSSIAGVVRLRLVEYDTHAQLQSGGTGGLTFELYTRPRRADDRDDVGAAGEPAGGSSELRGGSVGVDCLDCTFPCSSGKTASERDCFRSGAEAWQKTICNNTCEQIHRSCLRGCPGCN